MDLQFCQVLDWVLIGLIDITKNHTQNAKKPQIFAQCGIIIMVRAHSINKLYSGRSYIRQEITINEVWVKT